MDIAQLHTLFLKHPKVCTDTRKIEPDCLFFALKGPNFNGNRFAKEALQRGAAIVVVDEVDGQLADQMVLVDDVLQTLQQLGTYHRNHCTAKVIGLTGSNGKTTTKELVHAVLRQKYRTIATKGNLNNHIGVPLTLLTIKPDTEFAIIEMGANHQGEIELLSSLAQPDYGYITNFGKAHLEGFGGVEGVIKGKSELYHYLMANDRFAFLNADDPIQQEKLKHYIKKIGFSERQHQYFQITSKAAQPFVCLEFENTQVDTQLIGTYNFPNCCIAVLIGKYFNIPPQDIKNALENYVPQNNRSQVIRQGGRKIVLDAYNANPSSMKAALENFNTMQGGMKAVFLGDMFELGDDAADEHQALVHMLEKMDFEQVFLVGSNFSDAKSHFHTFTTTEALQKHLATAALPADLLLIKGSRGMAMERLLEVL